MYESPAVVSQVQHKSVPKRYATILSYHIIIKRYFSMNLCMHLINLCERQIDAVVGAGILVQSADDSTS